MGDEFTWNDRYAGDEAWTEWFEICSVDLCRPEFAARLREQVSAALYSRLARAGISREDAGGEEQCLTHYVKIRAQWVENLYALIFWI